MVVEFVNFQIRHEKRIFVSNFFEPTHHIQNSFESSTIVFQTVPQFSKEWHYLKTLKFD